MKIFIFTLGFILGAFIATLFTLCYVCNIKKKENDKCEEEKCEAPELDCKQRENLKLEYNSLLQDVHQRGSEFITFISLFISASFLVLITILDPTKTFTIAGLNAKYIIVPLIIMILTVSWFNMCSVNRLDNLFWDRIKEIECLLGIEYGHHGIWEKIQYAPWYRARRCIWNIIFSLILLTSFIVLLFK